MFANAAAEADATIKRLGPEHHKSTVARKIIELIRAISHDDHGLIELAKGNSAAVGGPAAATALGDLTALFSEFKGMHD